MLLMLALSQPMDMMLEGQVNKQGPYSHVWLIPVGQSIMPSGGFVV